MLSAMLTGHGMACRAVECTADTMPYRRERCGGEKGGTLMLIHVPWPNPSMQQVATWLHCRSGTLQLDWGKRQLLRGRHPADRLVADIVKNWSRRCRHKRCLPLTEFVSM